MARPPDTHAAPLDCIVVGAGLAGAAAAAVLGREGRRVALVDPRPVCPPTFKAEKLEPDQAEVLQRLGLLAGVLPHATAIHAVHEAHRGHVLRVKPTVQYGIVYQDLVNATRRQVPATVDTRVGRVVQIDPSGDLQQVTLDNGERLSARLVVVAAGASERLDRMLGVRRRVIRPAHSLCTGFDIERIDRSPFPFDALTYYADTRADDVDFVSLFRVPGRMRVNVFSHHGAKDPWLKAIAAAPGDVLGRTMPGLSRVSGEWRVTSKVESRPFDLYVADPSPRAGVVLLGDAAQSACPSTGTGMSKVLTDVEVLCRTHLPAWLATPGMTAVKIASFYADSRKVACDRASMRDAEHRRHFATDRSIRWCLHRQRVFAELALEGWRSRVATWYDHSWSRFARPAS